MGCYLCAYLRLDSPDEAHPLPAGSPVAATDPLGTCHKCAVWACSQHATRYSWYECAICTPAQAAAAVLTGPGVGTATVAQAHLVGAGTSSPLREAAAAAINRLATESEQQPVEVRAEFAARGVGEPNLVVNLAETMRSLVDIRVGVTTRSPSGGTERILFDVIGATVRERFADSRILPATDFSATVVAGALAMAYSLADPAYRAQLVTSLTNDIEPRLPPPWQVRYPALLDPTLWMLGTAYTIGQQ
ncbi:MAG: hypothetical protein ACR2N4_02225 [Jatrophihabitans sp.]